MSITHGKSSTYSNGCRCLPCKEAYSANRKVYYKANKERVRATNKRSYDRNRINHLNQKLVSTYGITYAYKEQLLKKQKVACAVCRTIPESKRAIHVDHDHLTGTVRGLLCHYCNTALGLLKEDEKIILSLIKYLRKEKTF